MPICLSLTGCSLAVFLGQSQSHVGKEFVEGEVGLVGVVVGVPLGKDHVEATRQQLGMMGNKRNVTW